MKLCSLIGEYLPSYPVSARERRQFVRRRTGRDSTDLDWLPAADSRLSTTASSVSSRRGSHRQGGYANNNKGKSINLAEGGIATTQMLTSSEY